MSDSTTDPPTDSRTDFRTGSRTGPAAAGTADAVADAVAGAVLAVPGVTSMHGGAFGEVATYLPGRRVTGVRTQVDRVEVHVVIAPDIRVLEVAERIHAAVAPLVRTPVGVFIEDIGPIDTLYRTDPPPTSPTAPAPAGGSSDDLASQGRLP